MSVCHDFDSPLAFSTAKRKEYEEKLESDEEEDLFAGLIDLDSGKKKGYLISFNFCRVKDSHAFLSYFRQKVQVKNTLKTKGYAFHS